jgi:flavin-dependent dehydrogenase
MKNILIVGGGLAGLVTANYLADAGIPVSVIEKKAYPFHRVCGEYISNETIPFLRKLNLFPDEFTPPNITKFQLTSVNGKSARLNLDLGGFGISRYTFDNFLYEKAKAKGVTFFLNTEIETVQFQDDQFTVASSTRTWNADLVIGAFGKRSRLDVTMSRPYVKARSPYLAVKYHVRTDHPAELISLHNFKNGYCGISQIEDQKYTVCYLSHRDNLKEYGKIELMEQEVLYKNPYLKSIFKNSEFLYSRPEVINEISFATKSPIEDHVLMAGDSAGMITPLCGNGMALAIHAGKVVSELTIEFSRGKINREALENNYETKWNKLFASRLWIGRKVQFLFGAEWTSDLTVNLMKHSPSVANLIIRNTHGNPF